MRFVIVLPEDDLEALNLAAAEVVEREDAWWAEATRLVHEAHPGAGGAESRRARREAFDDLRTRRNTARAEGRLLGSRARLVAWHLERALDEMGWSSTDWPALPAEGTRAGRRWGSPNRSRRDRSEPLLGARLAIDLPPALGEQLRRACYWHSEPAIKALQEWADRFGPGPAALEAIGRYDLAMLLTILQRENGTGPRGDDLAERERLRRQVVTTADVLRAAVLEAARAPAPEPPPL